MSFVVPSDSKRSEAQAPVACFAASMGFGGRSCHDREKIMAKIQLYQFGPLGDLGKSDHRGGAVVHQSDADLEEPATGGGVVPALSDD